MRWFGRRRRIERLRVELQRHDDVLDLLKDTHEELRKKYERLEAENERIVAELFRARQYVDAMKPVSGAEDVEVGRLLETNAELTRADKDHWRERRALSDRIYTLETAGEVHVCPNREDVERLENELLERGEYDG